MVQAWWWKPWRPSTDEPGRVAPGYGLHIQYECEKTHQTNWCHRRGEPRSLGRKAGQPRQAGESSTMRWEAVIAVDAPVAETLRDSWIAECMCDITACVPGSCVFCSFKNCERTVRCHPRCQDAIEDSYNASRAFLSSEE